MRRPIVLTGGPCGGKSTICRWLARRLSAKGFQVFLLPEAARLAISILGPARTAREKLDLQALIVRMQLAMEDAALAKAAGRAIILEDRGILDSKAYLSASAWKSLKRRLGLTERGLLERYEAVIHLRSCAIDNPETYKGDAQRRETRRAAGQIDRAIWRSWNGHPIHTQIDNQGINWRQKRERVLAEILRISSS